MIERCRSVTELLVESSKKPSATEEALLHGVDPTGEARGGDDGRDGMHGLAAGQADGGLVTAGGPAVLGA